MSAVAVVVDSAASIPPGVLDRERMLMVPYYAHLAGQVYRDMVDMQPGDLAPAMRAMTDPSQAPKTANPGPGDYEQAFMQAARNVSAVLSFHMTSLGSGAYQAACIAPLVHEQARAPIRLALTHFEAADEARQLAELVRGPVDVVEEMVWEQSPALCVHSGPGTVGLCYGPDVRV